MQRDYSLLGENGRNAVETGLAAAEWYHSDVSRKDMKALMKRSEWACAARHSHSIWLDDLFCAGRYCALAQPLVAAILARLWGFIRICFGFALA